MSNITVVAKNNRKTYIHLAIMLLITFVIWNLPPFGSITPFGMKVLGVFVGIIYGWCCVDLLYTSFIGFFLLGLTGYTTPLMGMSAGLANTSVVMTIIAFVFAQCISDIGVCKVIAYWIMSRKILIGRPWVLLIGILVCGFLMSAFGNGFAALFLLWQITASIAEVNNIGNDDKELNMVYAMILYTCMTGTIVIPWKTGPIMFSSFYTNATGIALPSAEFLVIGFLYSFLVFGLMLIIYRVIFKMKLSAFQMTEDIRAEFLSYKASKVEKAGLIGLIFFVSGLLFPSLFSGGLMTTLNKWGLVGFVILYVSVFSMWKDEEGKPYSNLEKCFGNGIVWATVLLVAITIPLCNALESTDAGVVATAAAFCSNLVGGMDVNLVIIAVVVIMRILTQVMHNVVMCAMFVPIFAPIIANMGGNSLTFFIAAFFALQCAYGTPAGSMMAGLIFGKEGVPTKDAYFHGWFFCFATLAVVIVMIPIMNSMLAGLV